MASQDATDDSHALAVSEERTKLADVVRHIEEQRISLMGQMPTTAAHQEAANAIQAILLNNSDTLYSALDQPYFGRLDYFKTADPAPDTDDSTSEDAPRPLNTIYLGIVRIHGTDVFSWTAPVGRLWYTQSYEDGYTAPRGFIATRVDLKRYLRIRERQLENVTDIFRRQLPSSDAGRVGILAEALSGTGSEDGHLQLIVETIEPEQYENIANVSDKVLIIQGAAGSGKSEIGLHRVAFLLSPFNEIAERERPTPNTTLLVGPSQTFLEYVSDILPQLGVRERIHQTKFSDWVFDKLSERVRVVPRILNSLLAPGDAMKFNEQAEAFKSSLAMVDAIERHVSDLAAETRRRCRELPELVFDEQGASIPTDRVREALNAALPRAGAVQRLNGLREEFISRMTELVWLEGGYGGRLRGEDAARARNRVRNDVVVPWCDSGWPRVDFREQYVSMLSNPDEMARLAKGALTTDDAKALSEWALRWERYEFDDSDIGALAYMDHLLNGTIHSSYRHIVVDEAQDISPIEFKLLTISSSNNWFTVLGDTAQRLVPYRGVGSWRELERVFGRSDIARQRALRSYRSTRQITTYNNRLLRTFDKNIPAPRAFERDGPRVEYADHKTANEMFARVLDDIDRIRSMKNLDHAVVAILVRDRLNLNRFKTHCDERGYDAVVRIGQNRHSRERTVLGRIHDVKGLEYDAVIVMGVNESFSDTLFNKKLLYLATTRAKHYLGIHWSGRRSPILRSISERGVNWARRRSPR